MVMDMFKFFRSGLYNLSCVAIRVSKDCLGGRIISQWRLDTSTRHFNSRQNSHEIGHAEHQLMSTLFRLDTCNFVWTDGQVNASQTTVIQPGSIYLGWF